MKVKSLTVGMVGAGGDGVASSGDMLLNAAAAEGLYGLTGKSFGPQIRGGESSTRVRVSSEKVNNTGSGLDYLIVLNWRDYHRFEGELNLGPKGVIFCESGEKAAIEPVPEELKGTTIIPIGFQAAVDELGAKKAKNVFTLGFLCGVSNLATDSLLTSIVNKFKKKGEEVVEMNRKAFEAGMKLADSLSKEEWPKLEYKKGTPKMVVDGNWAMAAAACAAGLNFFGGYPITPSTEVMQWLTVHLPKFGGTVVQAEDEISAMAMVCGASFAGARAMTTTSGPGLSLKTELIGMASMSELPCVIIDVQRGGPSTGLPTKGEQSDLFQALFSAHGDGPRPVLAPYDIHSAIQMTFEAFRLAEEFQTPVMLLSDATLGQSKRSCRLPDLTDKEKYPVVYRKTPDEKALKEGYDRFKLTDDLISPMSIPGQEGGNYLSSGIEHDEHGRPNSDYKMHEVMNRKRIEKLQPIRQRDDLVLTWGDEDADTAIITWGSSTGAAREAMDTLRAEGIPIKMIVPLLLCPLPLEALYKHLEGVKQCAVVELNYQGQLAQYLRMELDLPANTVPIHRSGGMVWQPVELEERFRKELLVKAGKNAA